jgi:hypothetical protein
MKSTNEGSKRFSWDGDDGYKLLKSAVLAAAGAGLAKLTEAVTGLDFGQYTYLVIPVLTWLLNAARTWVVDNSTPKE